MSVGIVFVSHSEKIAHGLVDLARQMARGVRLEAAGGTDDGGVGTSFDRVTEAITAASSGSGVVVLCDLGSAYLTAETAVDFLDDGLRAGVRIVDAPLVEGGVAAAVAAESGGTLDAVVAAARSAAGEPAAPADGSGGEGAAQSESLDGDVVSATVAIVNTDGLHARPAAELVKLASSFDARVTVNGADARSLLLIMTLALAQGTDVTIAARGPQARDAVEQLTALIRSGFGEV
ncbi:dihydroxyacetone kinase phosphoryl donor subunit DhaM [Planctomonas psychrotolerans]|uniref:dihydroxyacetone kinase phosphoryl donor subunit DhaM n=1 Tax=Planctomonas psychrotolerans TaxID=2528712 RepID=UPI001238D55F|nr:dihydroxyacetone kinase phosphoryl donor subunit DhaM [Planctomonas psychrotolerans]